MHMTTLLYLAGLFRKHLCALWLFLCGGTVDVVLALLIVWLSKRLIDVASGSVAGELWPLVGGLGACFLLSIGIRNWLSLYTVRKQTAIRNGLAGYFFSHVIRAEWSSIRVFHSGEIMSRADTDIEDVTRLFTYTFPQFAVTFLKLSGAFCFLFLMDRWLACVLAGLIPVVLLFSKFYFRKMRYLSREQKEARSLARQFYQECIQHIETAKAFRLERMFERRLLGYQEKEAGVVGRQSFFSFYSNMVLSVGFAAGYLITFSWSVFQLEAGAITFGTMTAFLQLVNMIQGPASGLVSLVPGFVSSYTAAERLRELEQVEREVCGETVYMDKPEYLQFKDVSFSYSPHLSLMEHVDLLFEPGKVYALAGKTGCGKTTLFRLMLGFVRPQKGTIVLSDGKRQVETSPCTRVNFCYVPQHHFLVSGTIRHNLQLVRPEVTEEELCSVLRLVAGEFVFEQPDGLDTRLNEAGGGLSGGQVQRLAIARALLCPGKILLLDEITSALDKDTEYEIISTLKKNVRDRIIIIVSHKPEVIAACDRVYYF